MDRTKTPVPESQSLQRIRRFKLLIFALIFLFLSIIEAYYYFVRNIPLNATLVDWLIRVISAFILIQIIFYYIEGQQKQIDAERINSNQLLRRQGALVQLSADLTATHDEVEICEKIVQGLHNNLGYEYLRVYLKSGDTGERVLSARIGERDDMQTQPKLTIGEDFSSKPFIDSQLYYIPDLSDEPDVSNDSLTGSEIDVPLHVSDETIGVLVVRSQDIDAFDEDDFTILTTVTSQAAIALNNTRLLATEQRYAREMNALHKATASLLTTLNLEELLSNILEGAIHAVPAADTGSIYLIDLVTNRLQMKATYGFQDPRVKNLEFASDSGYAANAVREGKATIIPDAHSDPNTRYEGELEEVRAIQSAIVAPLILDERSIGVLSLDSFRLNAFTEDDLNMLTSYAATATAAIFNAQTHEETQRLAITDALTDVYNRRHFFELAQREFYRAKRYNRPLSALMIDLDHFKRINDTNGHATGDQVLRVVAQRCRESIRDVDALGRYGGEEFSAILPESTLPEARIVAERIRKCICDEPILTARGSFEITISIGVASVTDNTHNLTELLNNADVALYTAKQGGRNCVMSA
jgi:diguanylate cyclase (GGDEF)-like protein